MPKLENSIMPFNTNMHLPKIGVFWGLSFEINFRDVINPTEGSKSTNAHPANKRRKSMSVTGLGIININSKIAIVRTGQPIESVREFWSKNSFILHPLISTISLCGSYKYSAPFSVMTTSSSNPMQP